MKRLHSILAPLSAAGLLLAACGGSDGAAAPEESDDGSTEAGAPVTLTLQWVTQAQFAGYYAALDQGYYADESIDLTIQPGGPDVNPIQLLVSGDSDIAIQQFGAVLTSREQGADLVTIGQSFERSAYRLLSFEDEGIESAEDFEGRTVGLWAGFQPAFSATAGKYDLALDTDVEIFNQGFDMLALLNGEIDLASAMTYNEYAQALASAEGRALRVFDFNAEGTATLEDTIATTREWADANPELAEGFVKATMLGWIYCRDNAEACVQLIIDNGAALQEEFQTWQMNEVNKLIWPSTNGVLNLTPEMFDQTAGILLEYGVITEAADPAAVDMTYRNAAVESLTDEDLIGADFVPMDLDPAELFGE